MSSNNKFFPTSCFGCSNLYSHWSIDAFLRNLLRMAFIGFKTSVSKLFCILLPIFSAFVPAFIASRSAVHSRHFSRCSLINAPVSSLTMFSRYRGRILQTIPHSFYTFDFSQFALYHLSGSVAGNVPKWPCPTFEEAIYKRDSGGVVDTPTYLSYHIPKTLSILSFSNFFLRFLCIIPSCKITISDVL